MLLVFGSYCCQRIADMDSCVNNNLKILKMRDPRQLIEECKKHLRDTEQYKHEYKKDIRKLITALEKQLSISSVVHSTGFNEKTK